MKMLSESLIIFKALFFQFFKKLHDLTSLLHVFLILYIPKVVIIENLRDLSCI